MSEADVMFRARAAANAIDAAADALIDEDIPSRDRRVFREEAEQIIEDVIRDVTKGT